MRILITFVLLFFRVEPSDALDNGLGLTPAMGYNTWNDFRCQGISASNVIQVAERLVATGLASVGYRYVNIDDCWAVGRHPKTFQLLPDPVAFPQGMKQVSQHLHRLGLKFGIYSDRGNFTCARRPGSQGYEALDAATFAEWGVDYLKEDSCFADSENHTRAFEQYAIMRDALNRTGRPIYFSLCGWRPWYAPVGHQLANSWRTGDDVNDWTDVFRAIQVVQPILHFSGPGGWNDPDMLVGSSPQAAVHLTPQQSRTQFSLWALMAAPLLIGSSVLNMTHHDLETYMNEEVIAVDQDTLGLPANVIYDTCPSTLIAAHDPVPDCQQIWARSLSDNSAAMVMINFSPEDIVMVCKTDCLKKAGLRGQVHIRDLWQHKDLGIDDMVTRFVPGNGGSVILKLKSNVGIVNPIPEVQY